MSEDQKAALAQIYKEIEQEKALLNQERARKTLSHHERMETMERLDQINSKLVVWGKQVDYLGQASREIILVAGDKLATLNTVKMSTRFIGSQKTEELSSLCLYVDSLKEEWLTQSPSQHPNASSEMILQSVKTTLSSLMAKIRVIEQEKKTLQEKIDERELSSKMKMELRREQKSSEELEAEIKDKETQISRLRDIIRNFEANQREHEMNSMKKEQELLLSKELCHQLRETTSDESERVEEIKEMVQRARGEFEKLEGAIKEYRSKVKEKESQQKELQEEKKKLRLQSRDLKEQKNQLLTKIKEFLRKRGDNLPGRPSSFSFEGEKSLLEEKSSLGQTESHHLFYESNEEKRSSNVLVWPKNTTNSLEFSLNSGLKGRESFE